MGSSKDLAMRMNIENEVVKKKSLYNITLEQQILMHEIELMDGELTPELENKLSINKTDLEYKSIAYLAVIREKEASNLQIDNEIKRLQALKKRNSNILDNLKYNLLNYVKRNGSFEVGFNKFGTRKSTTVEITDINNLSNEYKTIKTVESADKKAIKEAIKNGIKVNGASISENLNLKIN